MANKVLILFFYESTFTELFVYVNESKPCFNSTSYLLTLLFFFCNSQPPSSDFAHTSFRSLAHSTMVWLVDVFDARNWNFAWDIFSMSLSIVSSRCWMILFSMRMLACNPRTDSRKWDWWHRQWLFSFHLCIRETISTLQSTSGDWSDDVPHRIIAYRINILPLILWELTPIPPSQTEGFYTCDDYNWKPNYFSGIKFVLRKRCWHAFLKEPD